MEQVVFGVPNELGDIARQCAGGDPNAGDDVDGLNGHDGSFDATRAALDAGHRVADTARVAGFGSPESLRRVFVDQLGLSPKAYRERFRTAVRG